MNQQTQFAGISGPQRQALGFDQFRDLVISGPAGSGKTHLLLRRAAVLARELRDPAATLRIALPTETLAAILRFEAVALGLPPQSVTTHRKLYGELAEMLGLTQGMATSDLAELRGAIREQLPSGNSEPCPFRFLFIDDGQNLEPADLELLSRMANHVTITVNEELGITAAPLTPGDVFGLLCNKPRHIEFQGNFRNSKSVAKLASVLGSRLECKSAPPIHRKPVCEVFESSYDELNSMVSLLKSGLSVDGKTSTVHPGMVPTCAVIVPDERAVETVRDELRSRGVESLTASEALIATHSAEQLQPCVMTFESAIGLTFDRVFLPTLSGELWEGIPTAVRIRMMRLGITRAESWLFVGFIENCRLEEQKLLKAAEPKGVLKFKNQPSFRSLFSFGADSPPDVT